MTLAARLNLAKVAAGIAAGALAACAALEPAERAARAPAFDLLGRVAVSYDGRAFSSGVRWEHRADEDEIWLLTPTGQALAHILANEEGATLTGADQQRYESRDVESLTRRALGWALPLARLAWWVRGAIVPGGTIGEVLRDDQGRLLRLRQDGWQITYTHRAGGEAGAVPQRLDLQHESSRIRLVVDGWQARGDGRGPAPAPNP